MKKKFKSTLDSKFSKKNVRTKIPGTVEFLTLHLSSPPHPTPPHPPTTIQRKGYTFDTQLFN